MKYVHQGHHRLRDPLEHDGPQLYLTVQASYALKKGTLRTGDRALQAGRIRNVEIQGDNILLGAPFIFDKRISISSTSDRQPIAIVSKSKTSTGSGFRRDSRDHEEAPVCRRMVVSQPCVDRPIGCGSLR